MRVRLFGPLSDLAGWRDRIIAPPEPSLEALRLRLAGEDATLGEALRRAGVQTAVDQALVRGDMRLAADAEIAFLPPMSGG